MHLPEYFTGDLVATLAFGILAILLVIAGYRVFDWVTPKLNFDEEIKKGNLAMAAVVAAFILGLCYVVAHVVGAVVGG